MKKYMLTAIAVAGLAAATPSFGAVNLVQNGGFENGPATGGQGFTTLGTGSTAIANWTVTSGSVDYINGYWPGNAGSNGSVDLNGINAGTLSQTLTGLVVGQVYKIVFFFSANADAGPYPKIATANFGGTPAHTITVAGVTPGSPDPSLAGPYRRGFFFREATSSNTVLSFSGNPANASWGIALDSVSVSATPEPAAYASLLVGLGMAGFVARRRKRAMAKAAAVA